MNKKGGEKFLVQLLMASFAVSLVLHVKRTLSIVANTAKFALVELLHIYLIGILGHLKRVIVTGAALRTSDIYMLFMAEKDGFRPFRLEQLIAAAGRRDSGADGYRQKKNRNRNATFFHSPFPPLRQSFIEKNPRFSTYFVLVYHNF